MYIYFDYSKRNLKDNFPDEFGQLNFGFNDDKATSKNNYFLDSLHLFDKGKVDMQIKITV